MKLSAVFSTRFIVLAILFFNFALFAKKIETPTKSQNEAKVPLQKIATQPFSSRPPDIKKAISLYNEKKYQEAESLLWKNIEKLTPIELKYLMNSAEKNSNAAGALKVANLVLAKNDKDEEALTAIGRIHGKKTTQKDSEKIAIESLKKAIDINPSYQPAYLAMIDYYESRIKYFDSLRQDKRKNYYELRLIYQDMIKVFGEKAEYLSLLCRVNSLDFQLNQAQEICEKAIKKNPNDPRPYVFLGLAYQQAKEATESKKYLLLAAKKFPNSELAQSKFAFCLEEQKDYVEAYKYFLLATQVDSKSSDAWRGLARTSLQIEKSDESFSAFKKACSLDPKNTAVDLRRALLNVKKNRLQFETLEDSCR